MLHEAIFLATCLATVTTQKHCKLQRGCHMFAIFLRSLQRNCWKLFTTLSLAASLESPASKRRTLIGSFPKNCFAGCDWHVTRSNLSRNIEDISTFLATCNATFSCHCRLQKWGVTHEIFLQLVSQRLLREKLQKKLPRVTWPKHSAAWSL